MNNADGRFKTIAAVLILLEREVGGNVEYLLQRRQNTGFADGMWDFSASGHVEKDESMTMAVCREAKEEIGVEISPEDVQFISLLHTFGDGESRVLGCFRITKYSGEPMNMEPEKISELKWFNRNNLPADIIDSRKVALENLQNGVFYREFGWA